MTPMQQMLLGVGASKKTYVDDVFNTYLYTGSGSSKTINNGIDLSSEHGGMVWIKRRTGTPDHVLNDTVRGAGNRLRTNVASGNASSTNYLSAFNNNGFSLGTDADVNGGSSPYSSWTFRKTPGFFDVVSYTGNGSNRTIAHSLGCIPGFYIIKRTDTSADWLCFHREFLTGNHYTILNSNAGQVSESDVAQNTRPTSSVFSVGTDSKVNADGGTYVCYLFAGGESTAATARSVVFDGNDSLSLTNDSDLDLGNSDFTIETWIKPNDASVYNQRFYSAQDNGLQWIWDQNKVIFYGYDGSSWFLNNIETSATVSVGQWHHVAVTRSSNVFRLFLNGELYHESTHTNSFKDPGSTVPRIGEYSPANDYYFKGSVSNFRVVKGTAVYTSSFKPPTEPLTNITNTKLLCCNNSSTTGSTVTNGTITANGDPTASTDSPFDDPDGFKFGDSKEGIVKCGSYVGKGSTDPIYLGFEPQWLMVKAISSGGAHYNWHIYDDMRGVVTGGNDNVLSANLADGEDTTYNYDANIMEFNATGFVADPGGSSYSVNGEAGVTYMYVAIRRPDGYVGKPAEAGTDVFAMDTGNGSTTIPTFDSGFPIDMLIFREPDTAGWSWNTGTRLMGPRGVWTNLAAESGGNTNMKFDSNVGTGPGTSDWLDSDQQAWMWKRHAGFDVVTWTNSTSNDFRYIHHSLGKKPEMIWLKDLDNTNTAFYQSWKVWHSGLTPSNNNLNSQYIVLNTSDAQTNSGNLWGTSDAHINAHAFGHYTGIAANNSKMVAMLFASVDGISKVGTYTGSGSTQTITTGFQPRFVIIKNASNNATGWYVLDTTRGWGSGNDKYLFLDTNAAQGDHNFGAPTSTGFTVENNFTGYNFNGTNYIYYAHA